MDFDLDAKYRTTDGVILLSGVQALVRLPLDQHRADLRKGRNTATFISGYPGSPLGGYDLSLKRVQGLLDDHQVRFVPGLNEELAATAVWGSQQEALGGLRDHTGVVGMWYGKAPGVDRCGDVFKHANLMGVGPGGGVLALAGDDPTAKSSTLPCQSETAFFDAQMPVLFPGNVQEILDLGMHGIALSRYSGCWVGMKVITNVADGFGTAEVSPDRISPIEPELVVNGERWQHVQRPAFLAPGNLELEQELFYRRLEAVRAYASANHLNTIPVRSERDRLGIVACGKTYFDVRQAFFELGLDDDALRSAGIRLLKVGMPWPLEPSLVQEFARGLEEILVVEEKRAFVEVFVRDALYQSPSRPMVHGKFDENGAPLVPAGGELSPERVMSVLHDRIARIAPLHSRTSMEEGSHENRPTITLSPLTIIRTPFFCSGCPHNRSTIVPQGSNVGGGIGCHGMALLMPGRAVTLTQMGGEGAQWIGRAAFTDVEHMFQNIGDGTLFHSGSLAIRACVSADVNITFKILYNGHISMTGGQDAPGAIPVPDLTRELELEGVKRVIVCTDDPTKYGTQARFGPHSEVWHRDRLEEAQLSLREIPGVTAIIYDQECAAELRRLRKRRKRPTPLKRIFINEAVCEGCGDCSRKSNCLSVHPVQTEFGRKTQIHQSSCNLDYSCVNGDCPSFLTVTPKSTPRKQARKVPAISALLPEPELKVSADEYSAFLMGIGGTGVVTVSQLLATAAVLDGLHVNGLDQTGLAQRGGPVVSHIKISRTPRDVSGSVSQADLYLGFDVLTAADAKHLARAVPERTIAVVSTTEVPTGMQVLSPALAFPEGDALLDRIAGKTRREHNVYLDGIGLSESIFGDHLPSNTLMVGAAYQAGTIPISAAAIEKAIELNGVAVEANTSAFRLGRMWVAQPDDLAIMLHEATPGLTAAETDPVPFEGELGRITGIRSAELRRFQNRALARRYVEAVSRVADAERGIAPGRTELSEAFARGLHKLMAYKDEYEVARLHLAPETRAQIRASFGEDARVKYNLHPPFLRAMGMNRKISVGRWFDVFFYGLRAMRRVRGTPFDLFGYTKVRRLERAIVGEYEAMVERSLSNLTAESYATAVEIAKLPEIIRGYEDVKLANVERFRAEANALLASRVAATP